MKRTGITMTTVGTFLFLAAGYDLFGAKHLPVPLTVGIFLVSVVCAFLGPAIYVLTFPPERRKKIANRALVVSLSLIAVGLACTYLHVLGARLEIIVGVLIFCFFYGTLAFKSKYEKWQLYARSKRDAFFLSLFDFLGLAMLFLGSLFTFQNWHYGPQLIAFGFVVLVIGMFFWNQKFKKEVVFRKETEDKLQDSFRQIEIQHQKLEEKQKEITDSITYAKRIQYSLLANDDFYWATKAVGSSSSNDAGVGGRFYLAVCDSTGHGVPGAFMSLLNTSFLNEAITEKKIAEPNKILDYVREKLIAN
ncbi:MAG TPA: hypothetical protein VK826_03615, partial [Bacteroidia bacterium]|nr:hypothetical protein [Bacteroidia bacterium]